MTLSCDNTHKNSQGWGTPLSKLYRYVLPQQVWFLSCFGLKIVMDFEHYGVKSGMVFNKTTKVEVCMSFELQIRIVKKEMQLKHNNLS